MKAGDVVLIYGTGFVASAIKWITNSKYSHAALALDGNTLIEAQGEEGLQIVPASKYAGCGEVYTCDLLTEEQRFKVVQAALDMKSKHYTYDYWDIFRLAVRNLLHFELPYTEKKRVECAMYIELSYDFAGMHLLSLADYDVTPESLAESALLRKEGGI